MGHGELIGLTSILVFGIGAQWLAWRTKLPAILLLLISGIIAGPVLGIVEPDMLMGNLLTPFINISVAIILFEGGLSLRFSELKNVGNIIIALVSVGVVITWVSTALAAYYLFDFGIELSVLLGAILVVTGPTVILPLLRQIRLSTQLNAILKWEGIVIDPIGAMLAVLVFEVILGAGKNGFNAITTLALISITKTILFGTLAGLAGAVALYFILKRHLLADFLHNPVSLMIVVAVFTVSNLLQAESGLWATTLMGIALANQQKAGIQHIVEFKENLRTLLLSALFILLAARVELHSLVASLNWNILLFLGILLFIARPLSVYLSTFFSDDISWREKLFLCWMAPRGVVAASMASVFAIYLSQNNFSNTNQLVTVVFITIIVTVAIYGLPASWVARKLGVAKPTPNGLFMIGAHPWAIKLGCVIKQAGIKVLMADANGRNVQEARAAGLETYHGNILSEATAETLNLDGIGMMLSLTPNDEVNSLSVLRYAQFFDRSHTFQLPLNIKQTEKAQNSNDHLQGRTLFHQKLCFDLISEIISKQEDISIFEVTEELSLDDKINKDKNLLIPLFQITTNNVIRPFTADRPLTPALGDKVIFTSANAAHHPELKEMQNEVTS